MIPRGDTGSIRTYVRLWIGGMVACFLAVALSLALSTTWLQAMGSRIFADSNSLESYQRLEAAVPGDSGCQATGTGLACFQPRK